MNVEPQSGMSPPRSVEELDLRISRPGAEVIDALRRCDGDFVVLGAGERWGSIFVRCSVGRSTNLTLRGD